MREKKTGKSCALDHWNRELDLSLETQAAGFPHSFAGDVFFPVDTKPLSLVKVHLMRLLAVVAPAKLDRILHAQMRNVQR